MNGGDTGARPVGESKTVVAERAPRRAKRATGDARETRGEKSAAAKTSAAADFSPRVFRGALRTPRSAFRHDRLPLAHGPRARIATINFVIA